LEADMKTTDFLKSILKPGKHRRISFGAVLVMAVMVVAYAHGERADRLVEM
jgi:hypothetical protein